jgi:hypothetical protein
MVCFSFLTLRVGPSLDILGGDLLLHGKMNIVESSTDQAEYGFYLFQRVLLVLETVRTTKKVEGQKMTGFHYKVALYANLRNANVNDLTNDGIQCLSLIISHVFPSNLF